MFDAIALGMWVAVSPIIGAVTVGVVWGLFFSEPLPDDDNTTEGK